MAADLQQQLREAIEGAGISRYLICKLSGVHQSSLSRFVSGESTLRFDHAAAVAETLGLELRAVEPDRRSAIVRKRERCATKPKKE